MIGVPIGRGGIFNTTEKFKREEIQQDCAQRRWAGGLKGLCAARIDRNDHAALDNAWQLRVEVNQNSCSFL